MEQALRTRHDLVRELRSTDDLVRELRSTDDLVRELRAHRARLRLLLDEVEGERELERSTESPERPRLRLHPA